MRLRKLRHFFIIFIISVTGVLALLFAFLNLPFSQRFATREVNQVLAGSKVPVHIDAIRRILPNSVVLRGVLLSDIQGDTIIFAGELNIDCRLGALMRKKVILQDMELYRADVRLLMNDATRKYNIEEAFEPVGKQEGSKPENGKVSWLISIQKGDLSMVRFRMIDSEGGIHIDQDVAGIGIKDFKVDLAEMEIRANTLEIDKARGTIVLGQGEEKQNTSDKSPWNFGLLNLSLNQMDFTYHQVRDSLLLHLILGEGKVRANQVELLKRVVDIKKISLAHGSVSIQKSSQSTDPIESFRPDLEKSPWFIRGKDVDIHDVDFRYISKDVSGTDSSETGMGLTGLEMELNGLIFGDGHAGLRVNRLRFDLDNGFSMKKMKAELDSDPAKTKLNLEFETGFSHVNLTGSAPQSIFDLILKPGEVEGAHVAIRHTGLSLKDFDPFFPELKDNPQFKVLTGSPYSISGDLDADNSRFSFNGLSISQDRNFKITMEGKVERPFPFRDATGDVNLAVSDIDTTWLHEILAGFGVENRIPAVSGLTVKSHVSNAFMSPDFHIELRSNSGSMDVSGSLDFSTHSFSAQSSLEGINLGEVLEMAEFGSFYGSGKISGAGFSGETLQADFSFMVDSLGFKDYTYTHTSIEGILRQNEFTFHVLADDPFIKGDLDARLFPSDSLFRVQVHGGLFAQLNELHLLKDTIAFETRLEANLLRRRNALESEINAADIVLTTPRNTAEVQHLTAAFKTDSVNSILQTRSDFFHMDIKVARPFMELDSLGKDYKEYLATFTDPYHRNSSTREMEIPEIAGKGSINYHPVLGLFIHDKSTNFTNIDISVNHKISDHKINYSLKGTGLEYKHLTIGVLNAIITDSAGTIELQCVADSNTINAVPANKLLLTSQFSDWNSLTGLTIHDKQDEIVYGIEIATLADSNSISFFIPSGGLIMNHMFWQTDTSILLTVDLSEKKYLPELHMYADSSSIDLSANQKDDIYDYRASLRHVGMEMLFQEGLIPGNPSGSISGSVGYSIIGTREKIVNGDLAFSDVMWSDLNFKNIRLNGSFKIDSSKVYGIDASAVLDSSEIVIKGDKIYGGKGTVHAGLHAIPIHIFKPFAKGQLSEMSGNLSGEFNVSSIDDDFDFSGNLYFDNARMRINTLNTAFKIPKDSVRFTGRRVVFDKFRVLDSLNNELLVNGYTGFDQNWQAWLDLEISSTKLQVMKKSKNEAIPLNGDIFVDSRLTLKGPLSNPDVMGKILLSEGTEVFYRQMEDLSLSGTEKIVSFVNRTLQEDQSLEIPIKTSGSVIGSSIETIITIDPATKINFNLAKRAFDIDVIIEGGGRLNYQMLHNNQVALSGKYEISEGQADVKLVGWPNKSFRITPGGYIRWEGPLENPELNFEAVNRVSSSYTNPVDGKQRDVVFNVMLNLSQSLSDLDVLFTIQTADKYLMSIINTLSPEEQMKQAITILLFEIVDLPGISTSSNYMSQQVSQLLASQLNQLAKTTIQGVDISFGIDSYVAASKSGGEETKTSLSYEVRKSFLNNRAQFELSGRFDDLTQQQGSTDLSLHNVSFEYRLDSAATKYLKVYNEHSYEDVFTGEITKTGVGFTYRKRYEFFRDIWRRKEE